MITPPPLSKLRRDSTPPPLHDILPCAAVVEGQGAEGCQAVERWRKEVGPREEAVEGRFSRREAEEGSLVVKRGCEGEHGREERAGSQSIKRGRSTIRGLSPGPNSPPPPLTRAKFPFAASLPAKLPSAASLQGHDSPQPSFFQG